jgi:hypothetical protein
VRAQTPGRLAVLTRDQLDSQALLGFAAQQTTRLRAHSEHPAKDMTPARRAGGRAGGFRLRDWGGQISGGDL